MTPERFEEVGAEIKRDTERLDKLWWNGYVSGLMFCFNLLPLNQDDPRYIRFDEKLAEAREKAAL